MLELNKSQDKAGLGLPDKSKTIDSNVKPSLGTMASLGMGKSDLARAASDAMKPGTAPTKKHGILGSTISLKESTFARIEQLLQESKQFIEELHDSRNSAVGGGGAQGEGKGVQPTNYSATMNRISRDSNSRRDDTLAARNSGAIAGEKVDAGTGTLIKAHTVTRANAEMQGALNNQQSQARLAQQAEQEQQGQ